MPTSKKHIKVYVDDAELKTAKAEADSAKLSLSNYFRVARNMPPLDRSDNFKTNNPRKPAK